MSEWQKAQLGELATHIKDGTHGTHRRVESGIPFLSAKNIRTNGHLSWNKSDDQISETDYLTITSSFAPKLGDLLLTIVGSVGRSAIFDGSIVAFQRSVAFIRPSERIIPHYLFYASCSDDFTRQLERRSNVTAQAGLYLGELAKVSILFPSKNRQQKIATILASIDTAIEKTEALIAKYQQIKAGLMHDLFTRGVLPNGQLRPPREQAPELYQETAIGWIPRDWKFERLGDILEKSGGYLQTGPFGSQLHAEEYALEGIPVVMPQDINDGLIQETSISRISESRAKSLARHRLKTGDIIIARRGELSRAAAIGSVEMDWVCGTGCFLLRLGRTNLNHYFFSRVYRYDFIQRQIAGMQVGSTMPSLNNAVMRRLFFPFPDPSEQNAITERIDVAEKRIFSLSDDVEKLRAQKLGLMQDLLAGKVPVKIDEADAADG